MFKGNKSWRFSLIILFALLGGCIAHSSFVPEENTLHQQRVEIQNLYVYSFLDARADFFGEAFLKELEAQINRRLTVEGVKSEWLWYQASTIGSTSSLQEVASQTGSTVQLPVAMTVLTNLRAESQAKATHRLIIFPRSVGLSGVQIAERAYAATIAWTLTDISTGKLVLRGRSDTWGKPVQADSQIADQVARVVNDFMAVPFPASGQTKP
ncbi:hypothetical protein [Pseudomonas sp. MWU12-2345]|uniref:hypothetical protein n=1 Tax=Pseudomonas sp. MWU12-2345 TaxID=2928689 RepID=UPI00200E3373|nr:hypothetical protein [Pseudomonas sp. MWU12-2345]